MLRVLRVVPSRKIPVKKQVVRRAQERRTGVDGMRRGDRRPVVTW